MMAIASGIVVKPATSVSANPAAFIASLLSLLEINMPIPAPSATRVPVQRIISGKVMFLSIIGVLLGENKNPGVLDAGKQLRDGDLVARHGVVVLQG
jgi:hypothetical protein